MKEFFFVFFLFFANQNEIKEIGSGNMEDDQDSGHPLTSRAS